MHQLKEIIFTYSIIEQMEGNVTMGKYLEYFEDVDLDMLVDHCLWLSEEGLKTLGECIGNFFDKGTKHCIIVHRN